MFAIEVEKKDRELILTIEGMIDSTTSDQFAAKAEEVLLQKPAAILLDFGKVDYISSAGFRILFMLAKEMKKNEGRLTARNVNDEIKNLFTMVHIDRVMEVE